MKMTNNYDLDFLAEQPFNPIEPTSVVEEEYVPFPGAVHAYTNNESIIPFVDDLEPKQPSLITEQSTSEVLSFGVPIQIGEPKLQKKFITLPEGEYEFTVTKCERGYFPGSKKMAACEKFSIELRVETDDGVAVIKDTLFLLNQWTNRIYFYLVTTGIKRVGEQLILEPEDFLKTIGRTGKAKIVIDEFLSRRDGQRKKINKVAFYLV